jgi:hypothetical protein
MMRIPEYLEVAQWALLFALGSLVVVLYRQLGRLLSHRESDPATPGPAVGDRATPIRYRRLPDGDAGELVPGQGQPALIAFVDPTCPACERLVSSLDTLTAAGELAGISVLLLISDPPGYLAISATFQDTTLEIGRPLAAAEVAGYRATATPLLVAVDGTGVIRAAGVASTVHEVQVQAASIARESEAVV